MRGRGEEDENQRFITDNQIIIPGMPQKRVVKRRRRKGRAYKARMRALRDKTGQPVRAEIIEVGEEGLPVSELAELLVVNEADVVSALFMKGEFCGGVMFFCASVHCYSLPAEGLNEAKVNSALLTKGGFCGGVCFLCFVFAAICCVRNGFSASMKGVFGGGSCTISASVQC